MVGGPISPSDVSQPQTRALRVSRCPKCSVSAFALASLGGSPAASLMLIWSAYSSTTSHPCTVDARRSSSGWISLLWSMVLTRQ